MNMKKTIIILSIVAVCILFGTSFALKQEQAPLSSQKTEKIRTPADVKKRLPDLTVTEMHFDEDCGHLYFTVKNIGGAMTEPYISFLIEDKNKIHLSNTNHSGNVQKAGGQETFEWLGGASMLQAPITIFANPGHKIIESNYNNNSLKTMQCE